MVKEDKENKKGFSYGRARIEDDLINRTMAQIFDLEKYTQNMIIPRNQQELFELIQGRDYEETMESWVEEVRKVARDTDIECAQKLKYVRQQMYATDQKKTIALITKDQTPQCEIDHEIIR
jgi:microcompartment protein CcmL/EutN